MRWVRRHRQALWLVITLCFLGFSLLRAWDRFQRSQLPSERSEGHERVGQPSLDPFESESACRRGLAQGSADGQHADPGPRVLSWNLRWFPYGVPPEQATSETPDVDVDWLACIMARTGASVVALQEVVADRRGRGALTRLSEALTGFARQAVATRGPFRVAIDPCPDRHQHLAYLIDEGRHPAARVTPVAAINPAGGMCVGGLRPGLRLDLPELGVSVLNVHLDSGRRASDAVHRATSLQRASELAKDERVGLIVLGDLNLMGCADCQPGYSAQDEREGLLSQLGLRALDLARDGEPFCTHYHRGRGIALDRALAAGAVPNTAAARVLGPCAQLGCSGRPSQASRAALPMLSDHCPLLLAL